MYAYRVEDYYQNPSSTLIIHTAPYYSVLFSSRRVSETLRDHTNSTIVPDFHLIALVRLNFEAAMKRSLWHYFFLLRLVYNYLLRSEED